MLSNGKHSSRLIFLLNICQNQIKSNVKCMFYSGHALSYTKLVHRHATQTEGNKIFQMNITSLKIPTGGRQTSWLFTSMTEELN